MAWALVVSDIRRDVVVLGVFCSIIAPRFLLLINLKTTIIMRRNQQQLTEKSG